MINFFRRFVIKFNVTGYLDFFGENMVKAPIFESFIGFSMTLAQWNTSIEWGFRQKNNKVILVSSNVMRSTVILGPFTRKDIFLLFCLFSLHSFLYKTRVCYVHKARKPNNFCIYLVIGKLKISAIMLYKEEDNNIAA